MPDLARPPAVPINARRVVVVIEVAWFVAFLALLPFYGWLDHHGHLSWLWIALAGWCLGLVGLAIMSRHRRAGRTI